MGESKTVGGAAGASWPQRSLRGRARMADPGKVQGEGDYESARKFDRDEAAFVRSGKVDQAARDAEPKSPEEAEAMRKAEEEGRSRSKGEDPALTNPGNASRESDTTRSSGPSGASS